MTEQKIHNICKVYNINNYKINSDGSIDVDKNDPLKGCFGVCKMFVPNEQ